MKKEEIAKIIGSGGLVRENSNGTAYEIQIPGRDVDLVITVPFEVHEIFYEARDKKGTLLFKDWRDHYGETELEDFKESMFEIAHVMKSPIFRVTNKGKTLEAKNEGWFYLFGHFGS